MRIKNLKALYVELDQSVERIKRGEIAVLYFEGKFTLNGVYELMRIAREYLENKHNLDVGIAYVTDGIERIWLLIGKDVDENFVQDLAVKLIRAILSKHQSS